MVLSTFGVMFTADHDRAAAEMLRVCRPGRHHFPPWRTGRRTALSAPSSRTLGPPPPPPGARSPALWGTQVRLAELFAGAVESIDAQRRDYVFRYRSPAHWLEVFRTWYGPVHKAFGALDAEKQKALAGDIEALLARLNRARDGTLVLPSEYLEVVAVRA